MEDENREYSKWVTKEAEKTARNAGIGAKESVSVTDTAGNAAPLTGNQQRQTQTMHTTESAATTQPKIPLWFYFAAKASYYGGWFEQFAHGIIPDDEL